MAQDSKNRKRPPNEARIGLVVPPEFKVTLMSEAKRRRMPAQVLVRLAVEKMLQQTNAA
jgi:hypothetical protein